MNQQADTQILKNFLATASKDELLRAIRLELDAVAAHRGWLAIHLTGAGATKELYLYTFNLKKAGIEISDNTALRKIALDEFRENFNLPTKYK